jgi:hypothetical protein
VLSSLLREPAQLLHLARQLIAQPLELLEAEQARAACRRAARDGADVRKAVRDDRRQLALELCDLVAQRSPRGKLPLHDAAIRSRSLDPAAIDR